MKINLIFGIVFLVLALNVSALNISNSDYDIHIFKDHTATFSIDIFNDELVDIYDVQFTDISILDFPVIEKIPANSSLKYNFTAYTNETINTQLTSKLIWFYKEIVLSDEDTFYVNVTDSGFIPSTINADINDIIIFTNVGNEEHTISEFNNLFVFNILEAESYSLSYDEQGNFTVVDENTGYIMNLNLENSSKYVNVHYNNDDIPVIFNIVANYGSSELDYDVFTTDFNIDYNGYADGVLEIRALEDTYDIHLDLEWATFDENDFPLAKDQSKIITFRIEPHINATSETNKTYQNFLDITSSNTPSYSELIKINIPYIYLGDEDTEEKSYVYLFDEDACYDYCEKYPDRCPLKTETKIEYILKDQNITFSKDLIDNLVSEIQRLKNKLDTQASETSNLGNTIDKFQHNLSGDITYLKTEQDKENDAEINRNTSIGFIIVSILVGIVTILLFVFLPKIIKQIRTKKYKEGGLL